MFSKLLKHELRAQRGVLGILSLAALGAGLLGGLIMWIFTYIEKSNSIADSAAVESEITTALLASFSMTLMMGAVFAIVAYVIGVWILLLYRFYKHHFSDEGYLTFTLPATTHQILLSSILNIVIWSVICLVVTAAALFMIFAPVIHMAMQNIDETAFQFGNLWFDQLDTDYLLLQAFSTVASAVYSLILPLLSITLGALAAKKHKLLAAFGIYYGISTILSIIVSILQVFSLLGDYSISAGSESLYLVFTILIPALLHLGIGIGGYFLMHALVDKKLNLP